MDSRPDLPPPADLDIVLRHPDVRAALASGDVGAIVRSVRGVRRLTLTQLAARCGYSVSTMSRMENGKRPLTDVPTLRLIADALAIPVHVLGLADARGATPRGCTGVSCVVARLGGYPTPDEGIDSMRRRTLLTGLAGAAALGGTLHTGHRAVLAGVPSAEPITTLENTLLTPSAAARPLSLSGLDRAVDEARSVFQAGRYTDVTAQLPELLGRAAATRAEATGHALELVNGHLSGLYELTAELMIKFGRGRSAWTAADRAVQAADSSGDPLAQATARRMWGIVLRRDGHAELAERLVLDTAAALQNTLHHGPDHLSVYGALLSTGAYTAAVDGDRDTAHTLLGEAVNTARRLGRDGNHRFTAFGPTGVGLYRISTARVLGDYGQAVDLARRIDPAAIPNAERRARYWSDVARSFHPWGKPEHSYRALLAAEAASPDEVRYREPVQKITTSLLDHPTARTLPGLQAFAHRVGAQV